MIKLKNCKIEVFLRLKKNAGLYMNHKMWLIILNNTRNKFPKILEKL